MKRLKVVYWAVRENYGDCLSPFVVHELSGLAIQQKDVSYIQKPLLSLLREFLLHGKLEFRLSSRFLPFEKNYVCIGSILSQGNKYSHIWGPGFLKPGGVIKEGTIYSVRGNLSKETILKQKNKGNVKIVGNIQIGDPALLLPRLIPAADKVRYKVGIIPHYSEYDYFYEKYGNRYHVINLATSDVIRVTKDITSCEYILSTSLHGLIVPHAYNIPALWIEHRELQPDSDGYKFKDYFSSVGITQKKPLRNIDNILRDYDAIDNLFKKMKEYTLPQVNVDIICKNLLKSAPFPLKEKYREFTK